MNQDKEKEYKKQYNNFLKRKIEEYCNENGYYKICWGYNESLYPDELLEAFRNYKKEGYEEIEDYIESKLYEYCTNNKDELDLTILNDLQNEDFYTEEFEEWFEKNSNIYGDLRNNGYNGLDINLEDFIKKSKFHINIMFATPEEQNRDMCSIFSSYQELCDTLEFDKKFDNSLTYLIHQQGHTIQEFFECRKYNPRGIKTDNNSNLVESVVFEINNFLHCSMSELTALVELDGEDALEFLNCLGDEYSNKNLKLGKNTIFGLFNEWFGTGHTFGIELEKDFIVPKQMIRNIQIEGANINDGCTVNKVNDLISDCWKKSLSLTNEEPELQEEDMEKTKNYLNEHILEDEEEL